MTTDFSKIKWLLMDVDGVMTNGYINYTASGDEIKSFNVKDGQGIKIFKRLGFKVGIITGRTSPIVERRAMELQMDFCVQGREDKLNVFNQLLKEQKLASDQFAYIGDDIPDYEVLKAVGFAACPNDAVNEIKQVSHLVTNLNGGCGAVREVIDFILMKKGISHV